MARIKSHYCPRYRRRRCRHCLTSEKPTKICWHHVQSYRVLVAPEASGIIRILSPADASRMVDPKCTLPSGVRRSQRHILAHGDKEAVDKTELPITSRPEQKACALTLLPAELFCEILAFLVPQDCCFVFTWGVTAAAIDSRVVVHQIRVGDDNIRRPIQITSLALVSQRFAATVYDLFYGRNDFVLSISSSTEPKCCLYSCDPELSVRHANHYIRYHVTRSSGPSACLFLSDTVIDHLTDLTLLFMLDQDTQRAVASTERLRRGVSDIIARLKRRNTPLTQLTIAVSQSRPQRDEDNMGSAFEYKVSIGRRSAGAHMWNFASPLSQDRQQSDSRLRDAARRILTPLSGLQTVKGLSISGLSTASVDSEIFLNQLSE